MIFLTFIIFICQYQYMHVCCSKTILALECLYQPKDESHRYFEGCFLQNKIKQNVQTTPQNFPPFPLCCYVLLRVLLLPIMCTLSVSFSSSDMPLKVQILIWEHEHFSYGANSGKVYLYCPTSFSPKSKCAHDLQKDLTNKSRLYSLSPCFSQVSSFPRK